MNLPHIAAVTIADGAAFVDEFTEERIRDARLVALAGRVDVTVDPDISLAAKVLPAAGVRRLQELVDEVDTLEDAGRLATALVPGGTT
jgi:2-methylcitrate dehydratase PrpD